MPKVQAETASGLIETEVPAGKKLVLAIEDAGVDILHRCGGNARCTTCRVELLEGDNNWPAIMKALDEVGYHTWACIEMPGGDLERLKKLSHQLDRILAM